RARSSMYVLYDTSPDIVVIETGTENRSDYHLGYFSRFGDSASDVEPIWDLYKTEVRSAARVLGQPESVITKHPTAGLWGGQTDEDELGFSYQDADLVMVCVETLGMTPEQTAARTGVSPDVVARVSARVAAVLWKHLVPHAV